MPSSSAAQAKLMRIAAHTPGGYGGVPAKVGTEFYAADKGHWSKSAGGTVSGALALANAQSRTPFAGGGYTPPAPTFGAREAFREQIHPGGPILSDVPGRTDHLPMSVAADSYVIPADVMSGLGEGNTLAGSKVVDSWMNTGPWGTKLPTGQAHVSGSPTLHTPHFAAGGTATKRGHVKIIAAGGEYVVPPFVVAHHPDLGGLALDDDNPRNYDKAVNFGHKILDSFVLQQRAATIKDMQHLAPPKKD